MFSTAKPIKTHTILFTEACPLACRYCYLKTSAGYGHYPAMTKERVFELVEKYAKEDDETKYRTQLLLTGGEPFLYWDWIKELILKYEDRFIYQFNTSGYLFTEEILEFLSHYNVNFVLSFDGDEKLTNYLRPVVGNTYKTGYFKQLKKIIPTLLYYFPKTPYRIIVNPRYVDLLHKIYLTAEQLGFKYFTFILDFNTRPEKPIDGVKGWTDADTQKLAEQLDLIVQEIILGFTQNIDRPQIKELNNALKFLLSNKHFDVEQLPCQVFNGRTTISVQNSTDENFCMASYFEGSLNKAKETMQQEFVQANGHCKNDPQCPYFEYCALICCPKSSLDEYGEFFHFDTLECVVNKVCYEAALKLLAISNDICPEAWGYKRFLNHFNYPGKEILSYGDYLS